MPNTNKKGKKEEKYWGEGKGQDSLKNNFFGLIQNYWDGEHGG